MENFQLNTQPVFTKKFDTYPTLAKKKLTFLRQLIHETAEEIESIKSLEETLKWGEPSFLAKKGSTIRMDWKTKSPNQYALYFSCSTQLIPTFRLIYNQQFKFEGKRAIVFDMEEEIPVEALKYCLRLALTYHQVKHLPMLGA